MADKDIGFLVVLDREAMVGVLSERDCARRLVLARKAAGDDAGRRIMVRDVVSVDLSAHIRGLSEADAPAPHSPSAGGRQGKVIAVVSIRDLLSEAVTHHAKIIAELERERLTIFTSTA